MLLIMFDLSENQVILERWNRKQTGMRLNKGQDQKSLGYVLKIMLLIWIMTGCADNPEERSKQNGINIYFEEVLYDYGQIVVDSDGSHSFEFKNVGAEPIVINNVRSTCGCTVPDWPDQPFKPGESGEIEIVYNTAQTGTFMKSIYVYSTGAISPIRLQIKGKVKAPE